MRAYLETAELAALSAEVGGAHLARKNLVIAQKTDEDGLAPDDLIKVIRLTGEETLLRIGHDERHAPFAADPANGEGPWLVSFTDELDVSLCAIYAPDCDEAAIGLGIDLCDFGEFSNDPSNERFVKRFFTPAERSLEARCAPDELPPLRSRIFSGKEAAFKATSQALRSHYRNGGGEIRFTIRDFEVIGNEARGIGRCRDALPKLKIDRIHLHSIAYGNMTLNCAVATRNERALA